MNSQHLQRLPVELGQRAVMTGGGELLWDAIDVPDAIRSAVMLGLLVTRIEAYEPHGSARGLFAGELRLASPAFGEDWDTLVTQGGEDAVRDFNQEIARRPRQEHVICRYYVAVVARPF